MWGVDEIKSYLKDNLKPSRYGHTLGVVKTAIELAEIYNEDKQKAEIAALCHDIAKNMSYEDMLKVIEEENLKLSNDEKNSKESNIEKVTTNIQNGIGYSWDEIAEIAKVISNTSKIT